MAKTETLVGRLNIFTYLNPTDDLYSKRPSKPVGVFFYNVTMNRLSSASNSQNSSENLSSELEKTIYPFVWKEDGPVELDQYFGY